MLERQGRGDGFRTDGMGKGCVTRFGIHIDNLLAIIQASTVVAHLEECNGSIGEEGWFGR